MLDGPDVGLAKSPLCGLWIVDSSLGNVDWTSVDLSIEVEIQCLCTMYLGSILVLNPNLVFLVGTDFSRSIVDHPAIVVSDSCQDNLSDHATR